MDTKPQVWIVARQWIGGRIDMLSVHLGEDAARRAASLELGVRENGPITLFTADAGDDIVALIGERA